MVQIQGFQQGPPPPDTIANRAAEDLGYPHVEQEAWRQDQAMSTMLGTHGPQAESEVMREKSILTGTTGYSTLLPIPSGIPGTSQL